MKTLYISLIALFITASISAQIIDIPDANFKNALVNTNCAVFTLGDPATDADTNDDGEISVAEAEAVVQLYIDDNGIDDATGIEYFINLILFSCYNNSLTSLNLSSLVNLRDLACEDNQLTEIIGLNNLTNLELVGLGNNLLTTLDFSNSPSLLSLYCYNNQLTSLNVSDLYNLRELGCSSNLLTTLDLSTTPNLVEFICGNNLLTSLDISNHLEWWMIFGASNNQLTSLFMKNGRRDVPIEFPQQFDFSGNPDLTYICADESEFSTIESKMMDYGLTDYTLSTYCTFVPGGEYYTIKGNIKVDMNANGCDASDNIVANLNFNISEGTETGNFIADSFGDFLIPVQEGNHTITPTIENPSYFTISPPEITVSFPTDTSPFIQNFCITPNGTFNDLEIIILPSEIARPGFDTNYGVLFKNKGNTTLSGNIHFGFEDDVMTFVSATPPNESGVPDLLQWSFVDLAPFESRQINLTMNLNTPTETPPLNDGDILTFNTSIEYTGTDETPDDNNFELNQTVVNSFDPNDKTCLEGDFITPEMVGEYVHYMIRFENTGSAEAVNIVVKDHIDINTYDLSTLVPLHASHDYFANIKDNATEHYVEFIFEEINLPIDDASNDGYIVFKIKTVDTLVLEDTIENEAEIYFDFNFPIITNIAQTTVQTLSVEDFELASNISIYPNPVQNVLHIKSKQSIEVIRIYDVSGRVVQQKNIIGNQNNVSISTENLTASVYFVSVKTEQNEFTTKLVKK